MPHDAQPDPTRRDLLRTAGQGALAAGLLTSLATAAEPPAPDTPPGGSPNSGARPKPPATQPGGAADWSTPLAPPDKQPPNLKVPDAPAKKVGFAIVGLGQLALEEILPAFRVAERAKPVALVSGHPDKAKRVAAAYGVAEKGIYGYENFDALRDNPEVEVVYIVLPNSMHAEYTTRAFKAGKHVLCEKPMAASVKDCEAMIAAGKAAGKKLMIAYRLHYEPYNQTAIELARKKAFGRIVTIEASNVQDIKAPNIRLSRDLAGGALFDIGIYCLNAARYLTGEEPVEVSGHVHSDPTDPRFREIDETVVFTLRFPSGAVAHCGASHGGGESRRYRVHCADGWFELDPAFSYRGLRMKTGRKKGEDESETQEIRLREVNHFASEMDHFADCVTHNKEPWTPGEEGLKDLRVIEKIFEAAKSGKTVKV